MNITLLTIARQFSHQTIISVVPFGNGNINDTYLVTTDGDRFILQRLNPMVFPDPQPILANQEYLQEILATSTPTSPEFSIPTLLLTRHGKNHFKDEHHSTWRAQQFISEGEEISSLHLHQGQSLGRLLGFFHGLCSPETICHFQATLPDIHATRSHLHHYTKLKDSRVKDSDPPRLQFCTTCLETYQDEAATLDQKLHGPNLEKRLIHGDPKKSNILFDPANGKAHSLIDLDTIGPGPVHHDLSDLIRSCCNPAAEDEAQMETVFDLPMAKEIIKGYSQATAPFLRPAEINMLGSCLWLIPFELGVRFFNDYLAGSIYFKINHPQHNLIRAYNQFKLAEHIHQSQHILQNYVHHCFG